MSNNKLSPQYILCYLIDQEEPKMGSVVTVVGKATEFTEATNPGEFDFKRYYQLKDCYFSIRNAKIMKQSENYSKYEDTLYQLRSKWSKKIKNLFQQPYAGIM